MPAAAIRVRLPRSTSHAIGTPRKAYSSAKAVPIRRPICVSLIPRSAFSGSTSSANIRRSKNENTQRREKLVKTRQRKKLSAYPEDIWRSDVSRGGKEGGRNG